MSSQLHSSQGLNATTHSPMKKGRTPGTVTVTASLELHPDRLLRRAGIIRQKLQIKGNEYRFDPVLQRWKRSGGDDAADTESDTLLYAERAFMEPQPATNDRPNPLQLENALPAVTAPRIEDAGYTAVSTAAVERVPTKINSFFVAENKPQPSQPQLVKTFDPARLGDAERIDSTPNGVILVLGAIDELASQRSVSKTSSAALDARFSELDAFLQFRIQKKTKLQQFQTAVSTAGGAVLSSVKDAFAPSSQQQPTTSLDTIVSTAPSKITATLESASVAGGNIIASLEKCLSSVQQRKGKHDEEALRLTNLAEENDGQFLSDEEVHQFVRQYFVRSVPFAAVQTHSLIATCDEGELRSLLSQGIQDAASNDIESVCFTRQESSTPGAFGAVVKVVKDPTSTISEERQKVEVMEGAVAELAKGFKQSAAEDGRRSSGKFELRSTEVHPVDRAPVPVVVVCCGGKFETLRYDLLVPAMKGWPIFLIEGSGGYTDDLCMTMRSLRDPNIAPEKKALLLRAIDPQTMEIIRSRRVIIVDRGQVVDTLSLTLVYALRGDETLRIAWGKYASWTEAAHSFRDKYTYLLFALGVFGILSTGLSVFQTVMQVVWAAETEGNNSTTNIGKVFQFLNLVVIFLPLLIQLLQSVFNKINAGQKWAAFTWAAENCLREIYLARAQALDYSEESVRLAKQRAEAAKRAKYLVILNSASNGTEGSGDPAGGGGGGSGDGGAADKKGGNPQDTAQNATGGGGGLKAAGGSAPIGPDGIDAPINASLFDTSQLQYSTRQELLSIRMDRLTSELMSSVGNATVPPYEGVYPPVEERFAGDDGFSDLTSDEYLQLRVLPRLQFYKQRIAHVSRLKLMVELGVHLFNTAGTVLGALATYRFLGNSNLQAWVAFTTSVVSALNRWEHWMLYEWRQRKYTQTYLKLNSVRSWWSSRGSKVSSPGIKSELCDRAENAILAELAEFCQQLRTASESLKKADDDASNGAGLRQQMLDAVQEKLRLKDELNRMNKSIQRRVQDFPLDLITLDNVEKARTDPKSLVGRQMKRLLNDLNQEFGGIIEKHAAKMKEKADKVLNLQEKASSFRQIRNIVTDGFGCLSMPPGERKFNLERLLSIPVFDLIKTIPHKRAAFLRALVRIREDGTHSVSHNEFLIEQLQEAALNVDHAIAKEFEILPARLVLEAARLAIHEEAIEQFKLTLPACKISVQDITPKKSPLEDTLRALRPVVHLPWRSLETSAILLLIDDDKVRHTLTKHFQSNESKLRSLLKRVEAFFATPSDALSVENALLRGAVQMDAHNEVLLNDTARIASSAMRAKMRALQVDPNVLSHRELVDLFPLDKEVTEGGGGAGGEDVGLKLSQKDVADLSHEGLAEFVRVLGQFLPANAAVLAALYRLPAAPDRLPAHNTANAMRATLEPVIVVERRVDQFSTFALSISQNDILSSRKEQILKLLMGNTGEKELVDILRSIEGNGLKELLSMSHAVMRNSFVGQLFDRLGFEMTSFQPAALLNYEDQTLLLSRANEFISEPKALLMSHEDILARLSLVPLTRKLKDLKPYQLHELLARLLRSVRPLFVAGTRKALDAYCRSERSRTQWAGLATTELCSSIELHLMIRGLDRIQTHQIRQAKEYVALQKQKGHGDVMQQDATYRHALNLIPDRNVRALADTYIAAVVADIRSQRKVHAASDPSMTMFEDLCDFARMQACGVVTADLLEDVVNECFSDDAAVVDAVEEVLGSRIDRDIFFDSLIIIFRANELFRTLRGVEVISRMPAVELLDSFIFSKGGAATPHPPQCPPAAIPQMSIVSRRRQIVDLNYGDTGGLMGTLAADNAANSELLKSRADARGFEYDGIAPYFLDPDTYAKVSTSQCAPEKYLARISELHRKLCDKLAERYPLFIAAVTGHILVHGPTFLFSEIARRYERVSIRDVFTTLHGRVGLVMGVIWNARNNLMRPFSPKGDATRDEVLPSTDNIRRSISALAPRTFVVTDPFFTFQAPQEAEEAQVVKTNLSLGEENSRMLDGLDAPMEEQMFLELAADVIRDTRLGQLVTFVTRAQDAIAPPPDAPRSLRLAAPTQKATAGFSFRLVNVCKTQLRLVAAHISPHIRLKPREVELALDNFREKEFHARPRHERLERFQRFLNDDSMSSHAADWTVECIAQLFAYFRSKPQFAKASTSRTANAEMTRSARLLRTTADALFVVSDLMKARGVNRMMPTSSGGAGEAIVGSKLSADRELPSQGTANNLTPATSSNQFAAPPQGDETRLQGSILVGETPAAVVIGEAPAPVVIGEAPNNSPRPPERSEEGAFNDPNWVSSPTQGGAQ